MSEVEKGPAGHYAKRTLGCRSRIEEVNRLPYADPNASFDSAVRHLFRHIKNPAQLRRNPLVRHLFTNVEGTPARAARTREKAGLELLRRLVLEGAEQCRNADLAAYQIERAARRYAIVMRNCLQGEPIRRLL